MQIVYLVKYVNEGDNCIYLIKIRIFKTELKENLILRQNTIINASPNIDKERNYIILKLN